MFAFHVSQQFTVLAFVHWFRMVTLGLAGSPNRMALVPWTKAPKP